MTNTTPEADGYRVLPFTTKAGKTVYAHGPCGACCTVNDGSKYTLADWAKEHVGHCAAQELEAAVTEARADLVKAGPLAAFGLQCIEWLAVQGAVPLSPHALYTGSGPSDQTFQQKARKLIGRDVTNSKWMDDADHRAAGG